MITRGFLAATAVMAAAQAIGQAARAQELPHQKPTLTARQAAPIDLTGYWVSIVTEDWRWRMLTPPKGDYASVPLNAAGRKLADDPSSYAPGEVDCRAYGAAGLMRMPIRLHITWADENTLKLESDWGEQIRMLHFLPGRAEGVDMMGDDVTMPAPAATDRAEVAAAGAPATPTPQGTSIAIWQVPYQLNASEGVRGPHVLPFGGGAQSPLPGGDLRAVTFDMTPGWLRRNGVPYGPNARMVEYYETFTDPTDKRWLDVTTEVQDPEYLNAPFITSDDFRSEPDSSKWSPHPCKDIASR